MKILDRYILKKFLINLFIAVSTWLIIFLVVDIIENLSKFLDRDATFNQVFMYYMYYVPYIISLTLPVAMLLAALFTASGLAQKNEITAQLSSGISLYRILIPLFIIALFISIGAGFFNETIVPEANQRRLDIKRYDIERKTRPKAKSRTNIFRQDQTQRKVSIKYYNGKSKKARRISIKRFKGSKLIERIDATTMEWKDDHWLLHNGKVRTFKNGKETVYVFKDSVLTDLTLQPDDLIELQKMPEEMGYAELSRFIAELQSIGADTRKWIVEQHLKIAMPFANFIVVLLGAPLAARRRRGGISINFGVSLLVTFIYFIIIRVGQVLGYQGTLNPVLGAWLGNLVFFTLGLYTLLSVRK
ncbi:MAG TPA: LPS export ABC transporter permease LptG [Calditrichaeota bacterium]|nr:LPS export ABC transporter permease LptG [Calditrichota bacterium]